MTQVTVKGLDELARELKRIDPALAKTLKAANKTVSDRAVLSGRPAISSLPTPGGNRAQAGLTARARPNQASVALLGTNPTIRANVFGASSHWVYGRKRPGPGPWKPWLGDSWDPEDLYGLGTVLTELADRFAAEEFADAYMTALSKAFPD